MTEAQTPAANWYPDPGGKHEHRYWDGSQWTDNVADHGRQAVDPLVAGHVPTTHHSAQNVQQQVQQRAGLQATAVGGGTLFTEPILVVNQKRKLIELNTEFAVFDQHGTQVGAVRQVGQSSAKKALRFMSNVDQFLTHKFQIVDIQGNVVLALTRPAKLVKSKVLITDGLGQPVGDVVQQNAIGKIRFALEAGGQTLGSINAENWRAWNFAIQDHTGAEVARITKTWEGLATTLFTTADNFVVQIHRQLEEPLRSLVVASALCVDVALKQDDRGFN
ncbi:MAG TPA: phospholipid scramblase-related protein [Acidimicrobiales bacterium]